MGLFEQFPYTNFHELNLDWLLGVVKYVETQLAKLDNIDEEIDRAVDEYLDEYGIDEAIENAINEYFIEHPIILPDGSVTLEKLSQALKDAYYLSGDVTFLFPNMTDGTDTSLRGVCFLAVTPEKTILFDCGSTSAWDCINANMSAWYSAGLFTNIDVLVISHYHDDHIGNLDAILTAYPHDNMIAYIPPTAGGAANWSNIASNVTYVNNTLAAHGIPINDPVHRVVVNTDMSVLISTGLVSLEFWNVTEADFNHYDITDNNYNNYSMISLLKIGGSYMMYPGDLLSAGQEWVMATHTVPHLATYVIHHHGYQGDDYLPFLRTIDPDIAINSISHYSAYVLGNNEDSSTLSILTGQICSLAYGEARVIQNNGGSHLTRGEVLERGAVREFDTYLYVDNSYIGSVHDGTIDHPFTEICEAIAWIPQAGNVTTYISVKPTDTTYRYVWLLGIASRVFIRKWPDTTGTVHINGLFVRGCTDVYITGVSFDGTGKKSIYNYDAIAYVGQSNVIFNECSFDGTNLMQSTNSDCLLLLLSSFTTVRNCAFSNCQRGIAGAGSAGHGCTTLFASTKSDFDNITDYAIECYYLQLEIITLGTLTNTPLLLGTVGNYPPAVRLRGQVVTAASIVTFDPKITSEPFYKSATYPCCIVANQTCYDVNGNAITLS